MNSHNNGYHAPAALRQSIRFSAHLPGQTPILAIRPGFRRWLVLATDRVLSWFERARSRRQLAKLDDRLLRDIGIARTDADREAFKPFWKD